MAEGSGATRSVLSLVLLVASGLALVNVFSDNKAVEQLAEQTACGAPDCSVKLLELRRSPLGQSFVFQTSLKNQTTAAVDCKRAFILAGEYSCSAAGSP